MGLWDTRTLSHNPLDCYLERLYVSLQFSDNAIVPPDNFQLGQFPTVITTPQIIHSYRKFEIAQGGNVLGEMSDNCAGRDCSRRSCSGQFLVSECLRGTCLFKFLIACVILGHRNRQDKQFKCVSMGVHSSELWSSTSILSPAVLHFASSKWLFPP